MLLGNFFLIGESLLARLKGLLSQLKYMMLAKKPISSITDLSLLPTIDYLRSMDIT